MLALMKTTLDLPADLVREMKIRAAHENRKLREVATEVFRRGLMSSAPLEAKSGHRVKLPLIACAKPTNASQSITAERVADVLLKQEIEWSHETSGH